MKIIFQFARFGMFGRMLKEYRFRRDFRRGFWASNGSDSKNYFFFHIPKAAGTTIGKSIGFRQSRHCSYAEYERCLSTRQRERIFTFAFIRDPVERFLSLYNYARMDRSYYHESLDKRNAHMDYETLRSKTIDQAVEYLENGSLKHFDGLGAFWQSQYNWLKDSKGAVNIDFIGNFRNLDTDLKRLCQLLEIPYEPPCYVNASVRLTEMEDISISARKRIEQYYKDDYVMLAKWL